MKGLLVVALLEVVYLASQYPDNIDDFRQDFLNETETLDVHPEHHNDLASAILAIETELGTNPSGDEQDTVALRLADTPTIESLDSSLQDMEQFVIDALEAPLSTSTKTASYTLTATDTKNMIVMDSGVGTDVNVPANIFQTGDTVNIIRAGGGSVHIVPLQGLTLKYPGGVATPSAIAHDAHSASSVGTGNLSWTHTPSGTPEGVVVMIAQYGLADTTDQVSGVTYGGENMTRLEAEELIDPADWGFVYIYFLDNPPTGAQTVEVTVSGADDKIAVAETQTGTVVQVEDSNTENSEGNPATLLLTTPAGVETMAYGVIFSQQGAPANVNPAADLTQLTETDFGLSLANFSRLTINDSGANVLFSWTQGSSTDDFIAAGVALKSVATELPFISPQNGRIQLFFTSSTEAYITGYLG